MSFEVASVKQNKCGLPPECVTASNVDLLPGDSSYIPTGGLFTETNWYLMPLIVFSYKLSANHYQLLTPQLPKWANTERFDIEARAAHSNPTKDQMRLMMQSLLADRFKLVVHFETRQLSVFALVLDKPGKLGPTLRPHSDDPPCADALPENAPPTVFRATVAGGYPAVCGQRVGDGKPGHIHIGERNVSMEQIGTMLGPLAQVGRPVLDQTGLDGKFDCIIEWVPQPNGTATSGSDVQTDPTGPTFQEALKDQLGLKLEPRTGPVEVLVIDHIEELSPN
jgi:bla regulator protein BlaR1